MIDGNVDACWAAAPSQALDHALYDAPDSAGDCSASFQALYDQDNLYLLVQVKDDDLRHDSGDYYQDDCVEAFLDADNQKAQTYGNNDYRYYFVWDATSPILGEAQHQKTAGVRFAFGKADDGYRLEIQFPWTTLGVQQAAGGHVGLDVQVNDDDGGGDRDSKLTWSALQDDAWQNPSVLGTLDLAGLVAVP